MRIENRTVKYDKEEYNCTIKTYGSEDDANLLRLYSAWRYFRDMSMEYGSRSPGIPEVITETAFCRVTGSVRIVKSPTGFKTSFDVFDLKRNKKQEIKATSIFNDLTSFSPLTRCDEVYWLDFYRDGSYDGRFDVYSIDIDTILNTKVNKDEYFYQHQEASRRPRFSVRNLIITPNNLSPIFSGSLGMDKRTPKITAVRNKTKKSAFSIN